MERAVGLSGGERLLEALQPGCQTRRGLTVASGDR
jgi:hypothetical protein